MSHARASVTFHPETWLHTMKKEDTAPEREMRHILEELSREMKFDWHSQTEEDFTASGWLLAVVGDFKKGDDTKLKKQIWRRNELQMLGFRMVPFWEHELLNPRKRELIKQAVRILIQLEAND